MARLLVAAVLVGASQVPWIAGADAQPAGRNLGHSITVRDLAKDGIRIPDPTPEPTVQGPAPATVPEIIARYGWPLEEALRIARCERGLRADAYNRTPVWLNGVEHHAQGVYQLLIPLHSWRLGGRSPYDAAANIEAAFGLWQSSGWAPWLSCLR